MCVCVCKFVYIHFTCYPNIFPFKILNFQEALPKWFIHLEKHLNMNIS